MQNHKNLNISEMLGVRKFLKYDEACETKLLTVLDLSWP
jgi:hypothetical protein